MASTCDKCGRNWSPGCFDSKPCTCPICSAIEVLEFRVENMNDAQYQLDHAGLDAASPEVIHFLRVQAELDRELVKAIKVLNQAIGGRS